MVRRIPLRAALTVMATLLLIGGGWMWLRDSPLVRVRDVFILGVSSSQEREIRAALRGAALDMTTLHVRRDQLELAVARFPQIAEVRAEADFPRKLTIEVVERRPVAALEIGDRFVPVGAGGLVMRGVRVDEDLPVIRARRLSAESRIADARGLAAVEVLSKAPPELRSRVERAAFGRRGLMLDLHTGPDLVFGTRHEAAAKWAAAARVLAEPSAAGAVYLDVRIPGRVAAGGLLAQPPVEDTDPQVQPENTPTLDLQ